MSEIPIPEGRADDPRVVRFGAFECDVGTSELRKSGMRVRLPEQPLRVLLALLERPGAVITREELRQRLWPADTFVDFDHGLNAAVKRLRNALGDAADSPRFVETVPQRGYRFVAPVEGTSAPASSPIEARRPRIAASPLALGAGLLVLGAVGVIAWRGFSRPSLPEVVGAVRITYSGRVGLKMEGMVAPFATDGLRLYFTEADPGGRSRVAQVGVAGGDPAAIPTPFERPVLLSVAPDGSQILVRDVDFAEVEGPLFVVATSGGGARRLGEVVAHDGAWSPDGQRLVFARGNELYVSAADGSGPRKLATLPGQAYWARFSPDARRLRFTVIDDRTHARSLWEVAVDGGAPHPFLGARAVGVETCCGEWRPDGGLFVYQSSDGERTDIWSLREGGLAFGNAAPVRLSRAPLDYIAALPSRDGRRLFVARFEGRGETLRYDPEARRLVAQRGPTGEASRDHEWIAFYDKTRSGGLWRSRRDGRDRLLLAPAAVDTLASPRWSPDGRQVAFTGREPGNPWKIRIVSADGRGTRIVVPGDRNEADPSWSPDGRSIMFGRPPDYLAEPGTKKAIHVVDLETGRLSTLPGSEGLFSPRWSPEGSHVAAMPLDHRGLMLFDFATNEWTKAAPNTVHNPIWSPDGRSLYFQEKEEEYRPIYRLSLKDLRIEKVVSAADLARDCYLIGLGPDDAPYLGCSTGGADLYALEWGSS